MAADSPSITRSGRIAVACAVVALLVTGVPVGYAISVRGWDPSALIRMGNDEPMSRIARRIHPEFKFVHPEAHYDGVYFYAVALDPFARGEAHGLIDKAAYRYEHPGYGWLAWLAALGRPEAAPFALMLVALAGAALTAGMLALLMSHLGASAWWGLAAAFNPGLIYSATAVTSEPLGAALMVTGLWLWVRGRYVPAAAVLAAVCFVKEPFILVPVGVGAWELGRAFFRKNGWGDAWRRAGLLAVGPVLFASWYLYLWSVFDVWPHKATEGFFFFPFTGWFSSISDASQYASGDFLVSQIGAAAAPLIAAFGGVLVVGLVVALRMRTPVDPVYVLMTLLIATLGPLGMLFPKDMIREVSIPLVLLPAVFASLRSRTLAK